MIRQVRERCLGPTGRKPKATREPTRPRWVWRVGDAKPTRVLLPRPTWIDPIDVIPISQLDSVVIAQREELEMLSRGVFSRERYEVFAAGGVEKRNLNLARRTKV